MGVSYYQPLYYDDVMYIHTRPVNLERVRLQFDYLITHAEKGNLICIGFTKHCALNQSGTPVAVDPKTVQVWKSFPV
jgi:acyl-CoA thioester hydrolase